VQRIGDLLTILIGTTDEFPGPPDERFAGSIREPYAVWAWVTILILFMPATMTLCVS
jgi:hypothetical protein